jgi:hypothetical protein
MWNSFMFNAPFPGQPNFMQAMSEAIQYIAQLNGSLSISTMRARAEMISRAIQEIEQQIAQLEDPEAKHAPLPGWGPLLDQAMACVVPGVNTKPISVHLLRAQAEYLRASHAFLLSSIAAIERSTPRSAPPAYPETVVIT